MYLPTCRGIEHIFFLFIMQGDGPPPDPKYKFLADSERDSQNNYFGKRQSKPHRGRGISRGAPHDRVSKIIYFLYSIQLYFYILYFLSVSHAITNFVNSSKCYPIQQVMLKQAWWLECETQFLAFCAIISITLCS